MVMNAMRKGAAGGILKFIIFGFLILAVGGMVFMDIGGFFRNGGVGGNNVAVVGKEKISLPYFDRAARRSLSQLGISPQDAYKAGFMDQLLGGEIRARVMQQTGNELDIRVDDKRVAQQIRQLLGPMVQPGQDPKDVLRQLLAAQGISERELTNDVSRGLTLDILNRTVQSGFADVSDEQAKALYAYDNEKRDIAFVNYPDSELKSVVPPTDEQLQKLYDSIKDTAYATPETRGLDLVQINTDSLKKSIELDEGEIRDAYENNIDFYTEKEQRTLEQALFESEDNANSVAEAARSGKSLQAAVKETTKRDSDYLGERVSETDSLPPELKSEAAAAKVGDVIGPVKTSIGWQVVTIKQITPAKVKSFDTVKNEIRDEVLENKIIDQQYAIAGEIEDRLAGGASLDEVKKDIDITVTPLPEINAYGQGKDGKDALAKFEKLKPSILENGFQLEQGETSPMAEMADGTYAGIHVRSITPKTYTPFAEVKAEMQKRWMADQSRIENKMQVMKTLEEIKSAKQSPDDFAKAQNKTLQARNDLSRKTKPSAPFNEQVWGVLFEAPVNEPFVIDTENGAAIAWVTKTDLPAEPKTDSEEFKKFKNALVNATKEEAFLIYGQKKADKLGARLNKRLLDQVYGQANEPQ